MVESLAAGIDADEGVVEAIEDHVLSNVDREVGGILVGTRRDAVRVEAAIPALRAVGERANVTFTHEVWDDVHATIDELYPGKDIVGWYHSHPGFGIFLSNYDRFIHENFFSDSSMLALVVDPIAGELGWFGWAGGEIELLEQGPSQQAPAPLTSGQRRGVETARNRRGTALLAGAALIAASLGVGYRLGSDAASRQAGVGAASSSSDQRVDVLTSELQQLRAQHDQLSASRDEIKQRLRELQKARGGAVIRYVVQPGDTLWGIAAALKGSGFDYTSIVRTNPDARDGIDPGDVLLIEVRAEPPAQR